MMMDSPFGGSEGDEKNELRIDRIDSSPRSSHLPQLLMPSKQNSLPHSPSAPVVNIPYTPPKDALYSPSPSSESSPSPIPMTLPSSPLSQGSTPSLVPAPLSSPAQTDLIMQRPPVFNEQMLSNLETQAQKCNETLSHLMGSLKSSLSAASAITVQHMEGYNEAVGSLATTAELCVNSTNQLLALAQQLATDSTNLTRLGTQVKDIKKSLDLLEILVQRLCSTK
eukprot:TRINITY_DN10475_c0_g2_i2.p1 TRINITY_DN10475_c0_g2~~TRINITY_DN10475_c0_g2_i2.p1  ORF type:complete len:224 (-),score=60.19 TRINITY_DN10475_c0_g2_i2:96-767(-)